jgi:hypothetical protein
LISLKMAGAVMVQHVAMQSPDELGDRAAELLRTALDRPSGSARMALIEEALRLHRQAQETRQAPGEDLTGCIAPNS